jgi:Flp pilus assembly protein TadG
MRGAATIGRFGSFWRRFARDRDGVSAVEFAIVLPFMLTLYIGGVELGDGMSVQFKTTLAARTVADLASQYITIDSSTMTEILCGATTVVAPFSTANMVVTVSEVTTTNNSGAAQVTWSAANSGNGRTVGSSVTLPTALQSLPSGTALILGEATYPYTPSLGFVITGAINIYESAYFYPRQSSCVSYNNVC